MEGVEFTYCFWICRSGMKVLTGLGALHIIMCVKCCGPVVVYSVCDL